MLPTTNWVSGQEFKKKKWILWERVQYENVPPDISFNHWKTFKKHLQISV